MKKVLIAVDDSKGTKAAVSMFAQFCQCLEDAQRILVYVEKLEGRSLIDEMLGDPELSTLRDALKDSDVKLAMDRKAERIFEYYRSALMKAGLPVARTILRSGHPAEEILAVAREEHADLILIGSRSTRSTHRFMGSVSREVADLATVPVLIVKNQEQP